MDQVKLGYTYWQQPDIETMPAVYEVRPQPAASMALAIEGSMTSWPSYGAPPAVLPPLDVYRRGTRWIEVFNRGGKPFQYKASADRPWVELKPSTGTVKEIIRLEVGADWKSVPSGETGAAIIIESNAGERLEVQLPVRNPSVPLPSAVTGFVENDGHVAIEAPHFDRAVTNGDIRWQTLPDFGRTLGGVTTFPVTAPPQLPGSDGSRLEYDLYLFSTGEVTVETHCAPSLDFQSGEGLRFGISFDNEPPQIIRLGNRPTDQTWAVSVSDAVSRLVTRHRIKKPGHHVLKFWRVTPGVVLERVIINTGGVRPSYLGPPESFRGGNT
jgi:hypothetical protein